GTPLRRCCAAGPRWPPRWRRCAGGPVPPSRGSRRAPHAHRAPYWPRSAHRCRCRRSRCPMTRARPPPLRPPRNTPADSRPARRTPGRRGPPRHARCCAGDRSECSSVRSPRGRRRCGCACDILCRTDAVPVAGHRYLRSMSFESSTTTAGDETARTAQDGDAAAMDTSVRPQDDLFRHVNGTWLATHEIPADRGGQCRSTELQDRAERAGRELITAAAEVPADDPAGAEAAQIAAVYASFMDTERIETLGTEPLSLDLDLITAAGD